jgi:hypothetical protein
MGFDRTLGPRQAHDAAATVVDNAQSTADMLRSTPRMGSMLPATSSPPAPKKPPAEWKRALIVEPRAARPAHEHPSSRPPPPVSVAAPAAGPASLPHWLVIVAGAGAVLLAVGLTLVIVRTPTSHAAPPATSGPPAAPPSVGVWTVEDAPGVVEPKTSESAAPRASAAPSSSTGRDAPKAAPHPTQKSLPATAQTSR